MQQKQVQKQIALTPADPLAARFCRWFNHGFKPIYAQVPAPGEKAKWLTQTKYPLQPRNLWKQYQNPSVILGLRFPNEGTRYCLIDIDRSSAYHPANNLGEFQSVLATLEEIGLCRPLVVRSSDSDGLHIYYFLPELLPTFNLACAMKYAVEERGFRVRQGQLEIFPNVKAFSKRKPTDYNGHRLPLQDGSYWLDDDFQPLTNDLERFLDAADLAATNQNLIALKEAVAAAAKRPKTYSPGVSTNAAEWKLHLEERIAEGWTGFGQTNELLKDFVTYGKVFQRLSGEDLIAFVVATAINASGYETYCRHQHEIRQRVQDRVRSTERNQFYSEYCSYPGRLGTYKQTFSDQGANNVVAFKNRSNEERSATAQHQIRQAFSLLESACALPKAVVARIKAIVTKAKELFGSSLSHQTLWKHSALWHPKHYKPEAVLQKESAPLADSSEIPTPPPCSIENSPQPESLETAPLLDSSDYSHTPPLMKVCDELSGTRPQSACPASRFLEGGQENDVHLIAPATEVPLVAPAVVPAAEVPLVAPAVALATEVPLVAPATPTAPEVIRRLARLRPEAINRAQKAVRQQALTEGRLFSREQRLHLEQTAKFRFYWESGEPVLMREATSWAIANPDALPEALPLAVTYVPEQSLAVTYVPEQSPAVTSVPEQSPAVTSVPLEVGDRVVWDNCPGHCGWLNPFVITAIDGDMASLDFYKSLVPLSELRRETPLN